LFITVATVRSYSPSSGTSSLEQVTNMSGAISSTSSPTRCS